MTGNSAQAAFVDRPTDQGWSVAPWDERSRPRVGVRHTGGRLSILDYRCPIGFGPPKHVHREDDEILMIQQGRMAVWLDHDTLVAEPGDIVFLPRGIAHSWRSVGEDDPHMQVVTTPGQFEPWLELIATRSLQRDDLAGLTQAASEAGMDLVGPPLTDDEVAAILRERG